MNEEKGRENWYVWIYVNCWKKDPKSNTVRVVPEVTEGAKYAELTYKVFESIGKLSLVGVKLATGRSHQIRVQFAHAGHPLIGDRKYGTAACTSRQLMLCACRLEFTHPTTGEKMVFHLLVKIFWLGSDSVSQKTRHVFILSECFTWNMFTRGK